MPYYYFWGMFRWFAILLASGKSSGKCLVTPLKRSRFVWPRDWEESILNAKTLNQREFKKSPVMLDILECFWCSGSALEKPQQKIWNTVVPAKQSGHFFQLLAKYYQISLSKRGNNEQGGNSRHQSKMMDIMTEKDRVKGGW